MTVPGEPEFEQRHPRDGLLGRWTDAVMVVLDPEAGPIDNRGRVVQVAGRRAPLVMLTKPRHPFIGESKLPLARWVEDGRFYELAEP